ncbi:hypothetical protein [Thalassotalea eurytherma]|uniref:hypothetical protein n=1 Tax=Thalassotalea eurytherma TaxID=1144278 RepID=UPI0024E0EC7F|nr:hypothetical protein [Thalassotalea eurytherma]
MITFSFPIQNGEVFDLSNYAVIDPQGQLYSSEFLPLSVWPNGSLKWVRCNFILPQNADIKRAFIKSAPEFHSNNCILPKVEKRETAQEVTFSLDNRLFSFSKTTLMCHEIPFTPFFCDSDLVHWDAVVTSLTTKQTSFIAEAEYSGKLDSSSGNFLNFVCRFFINFIENIVKVEFVIHNPKPMVHHQGKWDLGNENSVLFSELSLNLENITDSKLTLNDLPDKTLTGDFSLYQASSGGDNWQSDSHVNSQNENVLPFRGYKLNAIDSIDGLRAEPTLSAKHNANPLAVRVEQFWQNFPKKLELNNERLTIGLFPKSEHGLHELQPGEKKTHVIHFDLTPCQAAPNAKKTEIAVCQSYLINSAVIQNLGSEHDQELQNIIKLGLNGEDNFFAKREVIDEYGWRNFGELFADHEAAEFDGNDEMISHYNNQYDPLLGFLKQYLLTGNKQWLELANDLTQHVKDIDIYQTELDKPEYNNGLFWHTDHYVPAKTSSHRTYSKLQQSDVYEDHAGGGGPGGQHCYTSGLMLHYFLTGDETSKQSVIKLTDWIGNFYDGTGTVGELLISIKNKALPGYKNKLTGQYPLDRGTGHFIVALLDSYELTGAQSYLDKASLVIKNTASPSEDLSLRELDNIEASWFYTVYLQAVIRYLEIKRSIGQFDESFAYSDSLLAHFAQWMLENEQPYLNTPEKLEYPNHTWVAQDLRKANILYTASELCMDNDVSLKLFEKAEYFYHYVHNELKNEPTNTYTRILVLLMQNVGARSRYFLNKNLNKAMNIEHSKQKYLYASSSNNHVATFLATLAKTSLKKEVQWLATRNAKFKKLAERLN